MTDLRTREAADRHDFEQRIKRIMGNASRGKDYPPLRVILTPLELDAAAKALASDLWPMMK